MKKILTFLVPTLFLSGVASAEVSAETAFVFNTFLFVFSGVLAVSYTHLTLPTIYSV